MTTPVLVSPSVLASSLDILKEAGRAHRECVVLWLGSRTSTEIAVVEAYRPEQVAAEDFFQLPRGSIASLFDALRSRGLMVAAQVHTHPAEAFHSAADDRWAIVRHVDALSLVLPYFARDTTVESFLDDASVFRLSPKNEWCELLRSEIPLYVRGAP
jgi:proteasome lid subunit RPN8/RPN11